MKYHPNSNSRHRETKKGICNKLLRLYRNGIPEETHSINNNRNPYGWNGQKRTVPPVATEGTMEERATALKYIMLFS